MTSTTPAPPAANPANNRGVVTRENRVPMSLPLQKLDMPKISGFHTHWMRADESRIRQAMRAGYTFVEQADLDEIGAAVRSFDLAGDANANGNSDLGSRITVLSGNEMDANGRAVRLVLMKIPQEWRDEDMKKQEEQADRVAQALRSEGGVSQEEAAKRQHDMSHRYKGDSNRNIFTRRK
jgi:hypothetical protein